MRELFDLRPYAITKMLDLLHPMYQETAAYGPLRSYPAQKTVGDDTFTTFTWEKTDKAAELRAQLPACKPHGNTTSPAQCGLLLRTLSAG